MSEESKNKKVIGPSLPPGFVRQTNVVENKNTTLTEESITVKAKRVYGPSRPPSELGDKEKNHERRNRSRSPPLLSEKSQTSNRESWMTELGETKNILKQDPLNIKPRTFIQRRNETPLANQIPVDPEIKIKEKQLDEQIKDYNEIHRQKSLQEIYEEEYMNKKKTQTELDRQERIFDWERDMNSTVRQMSSKSAKDLVSKSNLKERFGSSTSKKYL